MACKNSWSPAAPASRLAGLALLAAATALPSTAAPAVPATPQNTWALAPSSFVVLRKDAPGDARAFVDAARAAGGHVSILYPEGAAVVYADDATLSKLNSSAWIEEVAREPVDLARIARRHPEASLAARAWNRSLELRGLPLEERADRPPSATSRALDSRDAGPRPIPL